MFRYVSLLVILPLLTAPFRYISSPSTQSWAPAAYLKASNTDPNDTFGHSVAVSGDTIVIAANAEASNATGINPDGGDNSALEAGAVYVYVRSGGVWALQAYIKASNTEAGDRFGSSVAISGDTLVVGADGEDSAASGVDGNQNDNSLDSAGAAYVFTRSGSTWSQQAYLKASNPDAGDRFGYAAAISGDTIVIGAYNEDSSATGVNGNQASNSAQSAGAAYVFIRSGSTWSQQAYLKASNTNAGDAFGFSLGVDGNTVIVAAHGEASAATGVNGNQADNSASSSGAAYVFTRSGSTWSQQAYIKASNTQSNDFFGWSASISGDTAVVGARGEDSAATGVNGDQNDESSSFAGAAYVYTRSGSTWSQQAYLKAGNTETEDEFGSVVAISGDWIVVGAHWEDGGGVGIFSDPASNLANASGAAYAFQRSGTAWSQAAYIKATNTGGGDHFGWAVATSGDLIVAGARTEDSSATGVNGNQADNSAFGAGAGYVYSVVDYTFLPLAVR